MKIMKRLYIQEEKKKKKKKSEWLTTYSCIPAEHRKDPKCPPEPKNDILQNYCGDTFFAKLMMTTF